ncbi:MAG: hypothetical protein WKF89_15700 [Chitinophagaceae bacterium]
MMPMKHLRLPSSVKPASMAPYQNFTYNAPITRSVKTIKARVEGFNLNISLLSINAFGFTFGPARLMAIITIMVKTKASPMQM